jgi:hypothetical protein
VIGFNWSHALVSGHASPQRKAVYRLCRTLLRCVSAKKIVRPQKSTVETQPQLQPALLRVSVTISQYFTKPSNDVSRHHQILMRAALVRGIISRYWSISGPHMPGRCRRQRGLLRVGQLRNATQKIQHSVSGPCACCRPSCWFQVQATHAFIRVALQIIRRVSS